MNIKGVARKSVNSILNIFDLELVRTHRWDDPRTYIPFKETISEAEKAGLSVGEYIDARYQSPGATQETIDQMAKLGVFNTRIDRVCEIGPGSGRYLEKTFEVCQPAAYEIYETADDWAKYLLDHFTITCQPTDGISLASTFSSSIDLVQAHRVFPYTPFFTAAGYFLEMMRVVKDDGKIVFDITTEDCMDLLNLAKWFAAGFQSSPYPSFMSKRYVLDIFGKHGFSPVGNFFIVNKPGVTEYFVFTRSKNPELFL